jgi:hypothetical protein
MAKTQHAPIDSPNFLGTPTAPTPGVGDIGSRIATTAYVNAKIPLPPGNQPITLQGDVGGRGTASIVATVLGLRGYPLASDGPGDTDVLQWSQAAWAWHPVKACEIGAQAGGAQGQIQVNDGSGQFTGITISGDASINTSSGVATVLGLRSRPVAPTAPLDGQVLAWSQVGGSWGPATLSGSGGGGVDAPADGFYYGRQNASWQRVAPAGNYLTANQAITLSGDATGTGATAIPVSLATVNANLGTFQGLTVNAKGLVTAAVNQNYLTNAAAGSTYLPLVGGTISGTAPGMLTIQRNAAPLTPGSFVFGTALWINFADNETAVGMLLDSYAGAGNLIFRRVHGTSAAKTATLAGDMIGAITSRGYDGAAYSATGTARIRFDALQNYTAAAQGTTVVIDTNPIGSTVRVTQAKFGPGLEVGTPTAPAGGMLVGDINAASRVMVNGVAVGTGGGGGGSIWDSGSSIWDT